MATDERVSARDAGERRIAGYASLFGIVDMGRDAVERGAFRRSLAAKGPRGVRMLFQHDPAQPIGTWTSIREDTRGLFVEGRLAKGVSRADEVFELIRTGAIDGLSIGFRTVKSFAEPHGRVRRIVEADLWEISIVTFPMLPGARVAELKLSTRPRPVGGDQGADAASKDTIRIIQAATRLMQGKEISA
jgi:uncharacterized protein